MIQNQNLDALAAINTETLRAFDWLAGGLDRSTSVTFVPNPGNIGDAAINLACFNYLTERFDDVQICAMTNAPRTECVFVGGGGNLVEPLYGSVSSFFDRLAPHHRLFMFPATVQGYSESLRRIAPFTRILCREPISLAHVAGQIGSENVSLAHDAAFLLAPRLRRDFASRIKEITSDKCVSFRTDEESIHPELGGNDVMREYLCAWNDMAVAHDFVWAVASYLLDFGEVETDRLHCGILAAILGRRTVLRPNSYFKNSAIFEFSLSRFSNATFLQSEAQLSGPPDHDMKKYVLQKLRGLRRRSCRLSLIALRRKSRYHH